MWAQRKSPSKSPESYSSGVLTNVAQWNHSWKFAFDLCRCECQNLTPPRNVTTTGNRCIHCYPIKICTLKRLNCRAIEGTHDGVLEKLWVRNVAYFSIGPGLMRFSFQNQRLSRWATVPFHKQQHSHQRSRPSCLLPSPDTMERGNDLN